MYIGFFVQIHGLPDKTDSETVRQRLLACLLKEFEPDFKSDIVVDIEELTTPDESSSDSSCS